MVNRPLRRCKKCPKTEKARKALSFPGLTGRIPITKKAAGLPPPPGICWSGSPKSAQELENALLRGVGERQRGDRDRLAGRQRLAVGRFLVRVGERQVRRTGLQHVDQALREVLTDLHDREVRTERRGLRPQ